MEVGNVTQSRLLYLEYSFVSHLISDEARCQGIRVEQKGHVRRHCQVPQDAVTQCGGTRKPTRLRGAWKTNAELTNDLLATKSPARDL